MTFWTYIFPEVLLLDTFLSFLIYRALLSWIQFHIRGFCCLIITRVSQFDLLLLIHWTFMLILLMILIMARFWLRVLCRCKYIVGLAGFMILTSWLLIVSIILRARCFDLITLVRFLLIVCLQWYLKVTWATILILLVILIAFSSFQKVIRLILRFITLAILVQLFRIAL